MIENYFNDLVEIDLQKIIHRAISDPAIIRQTVSNKRLQILSPGEFNVHEGPDFLESAILLEGNVIVGDIEIHKSASDWIRHNHSSNPAYNNVCLHIVLNNDRIIPKVNFETLVIRDEEIRKHIKEPEETPANTDNFTIEELHHFALIRLLRKTSEAQTLLNQNTVLDTMKQQVSTYLTKYNSRRRRPVYTSDTFKAILDTLDNSTAYQFLSDLSSGKDMHIPDMMLHLMKSRIAQEGSHLRREMLLNCILPLAICLANEDSRINLFLWFWSTPALHTYGILTRRFKGMPQNYLWEQQGMLEYMKEYGKRPNIIRETVSKYGFAEVLSFYKLGNSPSKRFSED